MRRNTRSNEHDDRDLEDKLCNYREEVRAAFLTDSLKQLEEMDDEELQEVIERAGKLANDFKETMKNGKESSKGKVSEAAEENPADEEAVEMEDEHEHDDVPDAEAADEQQSWAAVVKEQIDAALALDLTVRPRPKRNGQQGVIEVDENKRQTNERERYLVIHLARIWGYDNPALTWKERQQIAAAACRQIAYDHGFAKSTGASQVHTWDKALREGITSGTTDPLKSEHKGSTSATDKIETEHPGYLHELYRYAIRTIGITAGFEEITSSMNEKSATPLEQRPTLSLHYLQVLRWFEKNGGKEKSGKEKPRLTDDHKRRRVAWVKKWKEYFLLEDCPVAYLDEKWFYTRSRRRKVKVLPLGPHEQPGSDVVVRPKTRSRRFPIKVMHLGVVARPRPDKNFNGRILLKRVSKLKEVDKLTKHSRFSEDALVNDQIKNGGWKEYYIDGMTVGEMCDIVADVYGLDEFASERLEFHYVHVGGGASMASSNKRLKNHQLLTGHKTRDGDGEEKIVSLDDLELGVRYQDGDKVEVAATLNSCLMSCMRLGERLARHFIGCRRARRMKRTSGREANQFTLLLTAREGTVQTRQWRSIGGICWRIIISYLFIRYRSRPKLMSWTLVFG